MNRLVLSARIRAALVCWTLSSLSLATGWVPYAVAGSTKLDEGWATLPNVFGRWTVSMTVRIDPFP
jgi:hypothetical protein